MIDEPTPRAWCAASSLALALALSSSCAPSSSKSEPRSTNSVSGAGGGSAGSATSGGVGGLAGGLAGGTAAPGGAGATPSAVGGAGDGAGVATAGSKAIGDAGGGGAATADFCAARPGLAFCETFEALPAGPASANPPWTPSINGDGTLTIDAGVAHSGSHSLQVHGSGFSTFLVLARDSLPAMSGPLHVRVFVRMADAMTDGHNTLFVADLNAAPGTGNAFRLGEMNAMLMYTVSGDAHGALANANYYADHLPGAALTAASWGCVEVTLDHEKPEIRVGLDGAELEDLHHTDWAVDAYDALRFGFEKYAGPVGDVWYDDIAVGTSTIGCR